MVYNAGVRMTSRYFAAFCMRLDEQAAVNRFGFTAPRALGKAVERNRMKRRMREAVRAELPYLKGNWAIVFNPRRAVLGAAFDDLRREVARILGRCNES
jgi:ribonuclease P protein component